MVSRAFKIANNVRDKLYKIAIRVTAVDTAQLAPGACPIDDFRAFQNLCTLDPEKDTQDQNTWGKRRADLNASVLPRLQNIIYRMFRNETQIAAAGLHFRRFGLELVPGQVEVDFLAAELEGVAIGAVGNCSKS